MNAEDRRIKIKEICEGTPVATGTKLRYQGEIRSFDVYKIPLEFLAYNVENGRISSVVKSYQKEYGPLDVNNTDDSKRIATYLFNSNEERNKATIEDLKKNGQMEPGIITRDGVIVDGNRRASLLRRIIEDPEVDQYVKDRCGYFYARVLPEDADENEILRLETSYQMGTDSKVDYNPIEKYLHTRDMKERSFSLEQIREYMGLPSVKDVSLNLEIMDLIDAYLDAYDYSGIYTRLPKGCEDDFLKLNTALKSIRSGKVAWIPSDRLEEVETDLQAICFDFIRLEEKGDFDFRAIASTKNGNFLNDEQTWNAFVAEYNKLTPPGERSTEDVLKNAKSEESAKRLLKQRDEQWKNGVKIGLMDAFRDCKNKIENKKEHDKPTILMKKALNALNEVDVSKLATAQEKEEIAEKSSQLLAIIQNICRALNV